MASKRTTIKKPASKALSASFFLLVLLTQLWQRQLLCSQVTPQAVKPTIAKKTAAQTSAAAPWFTFFTGHKNPAYVRYMQEEWGWEKRGDQPLFEKLCLEGQQAGLSWATVLAKRQAYRKAFHNFSIPKCAAMTDKDVDSIMAAAKKGPGGPAAVILHKGKLQSIISNAKCALKLKKEPYVDPATQQAHKGLDSLLWSFVDGRPQLNHWKTGKEMPAVTPTAQAMSKVLKKLGFKFVGATICYSMMQSCGLVIDHPVGTPEYVAAKKRLNKRK